MPNNESMTLANEDDIILLKEVLTNEPLPNMRTLIIFEYVDKPNISMESMSDNNGMIIIRSDHSYGQLTIWGDILSTPGKDYFGRFKVSDTGKIREHSLFPTGSVEGFVLDSLDNVVPYAQMKFSCSTDIGEEQPEYTDKYGSFKFEYAPIGHCKAYAYFNRGVGISEFEVKKGEIVDLTIKLDKTIVPNATLFSRKPLTAGSVLIFVLLIILIFIIVRFFVVRRNPSKEKVDHQKPTKKLSKRYYGYIKYKRD